MLPACSSQMRIFAIYKTEKCIGCLVLFSSLEVCGALPTFDRVFGEKTPAPSYLFCCIIGKILNTEGEKMSWNRYEQNTCKFVEEIVVQ